jgi:hypothetical protein
VRSAEDPSCRSHSSTKKTTHTSKNEPKVRLNGVGSCCRGAKLTPQTLAALDRGFRLDCPHAGAHNAQTRRNNACSSPHHLHVSSRGRDQYEGKSSACEPNVPVAFEFRLNQFVRKRFLWHERWRRKISTIKSSRRWMRSSPRCAYHSASTHLIFVHDFVHLTSALIMGACRSRARSRWSARSSPRTRCSPSLTTPSFSKKSRYH